MTTPAVEMVVVMVLAVQKNGRVRHIIFVVMRTRVIVVVGLQMTIRVNQSLGTMCPNVVSRMSLVVKEHA
jgi:hypothetical protein